MIIYLMQQINDSFIGASLFDRHALLDPASSRLDASTGKKKSSSCRDISGNADDTRKQQRGQAARDALQACRRMRGGAAAARHACTHQWRLQQASMGIAAAGRLGPIRPRVPANQACSVVRTGRRTTGAASAQLEQAILCRSA